jgi:aspartate carbamoyltransferase regulatory subunit
MTEKEERFIRIAEKRTNKILEQIRLLGNCSNKNNYSYDDKQVDQIFKAIEKELDLAKKKYLMNKDKNKFSLR